MVIPFQHVNHQSDLPLPTVTHFVPETHAFEEPTYNYFPAASEASSMVANDSISSETLSNRETEVNVTSSSSSL